MKALITGITGFVGSHLAEFLLEQEGVEVYGTFRWRSRLENIEHLAGRVTLMECDLRDRVSVDRLMEMVQPDLIFHLAAQSFVPTSWNAPAETFNTNIIGQLNIFEAICHLGTKTRIQIAGSSEEYGFVAENEVPITEDNPLRPLSPYGVSKVAQDLMAYQYHRSYGLHVVRTRAFNHTGPRRGVVFAASNFAKQIAEIEAGVREPVLEVGNLDTLRDFTDVRDVARAYWLAILYGEPGEVYNIARGHAYAIREIVDILRGLAQKEFVIRQDPARMRPSDVPILLGDCSRFHQLTGWVPEIPFERTLQDLLDYWRDRLHDHMHINT